MKDAVLWRQILAIALCLPCFQYSCSLALGAERPCCSGGEDTSLYLGATRGWIFATDAGLKIVWKKQADGFEVWPASNGKFLRSKLSGDSADVVLCDLQTGKTIWSVRFAADWLLLNWGQNAQGQPAVEVDYTTPDSSYVQTLDTATGSVLSSDSRPREKAAGTSAHCSLPPASDTLIFFNTAQYVCALTPDLQVVWRHRIDPGVEYFGWTKTWAIPQNGETICRVVFLESKKALYALAIADGRMLWRRAYAGGDFTVTMGYPATVRLSDGTEEKLNPLTGQLYRRSQK